MDWDKVILRTSFYPSNRNVKCQGSNVNPSRTGNLKLLKKDIPDFKSLGIATVLYLMGNLVFIQKEVFRKLFNAHAGSIKGFAPRLSQPGCLPYVS
jgi:hypothetical protein